MGGMGGAPISRINASERRTASVTVKNQQHPPRSKGAAIMRHGPRLARGGDGVGAEHGGVNIHPKARHAGQTEATCQTLAGCMM